MAKMIRQSKTVQHDRHGDLSFQLQSLRSEMSQVKKAIFEKSRQPKIRLKNCTQNVSISIKLHRENGDIFKQENLTSKFRCDTHQSCRCRPQRKPVHTKTKLKAKKIKRKIRLQSKRNVKAKENADRVQLDFAVDSIYQKYMDSIKRKEKYKLVHNLKTGDQNITTPNTKLELVDKLSKQPTKLGAQSKLEQIMAYLKQNTSNWQEPKLYPGCVSLEEYFRKEPHTANQSDDPLSKPMNIEMIRLESFRTFPLSSKTRPIKLAKSGFFYTGHGDRVHCYSCGIIYRNWKDDDEPNEVHNRISPLCKHVNGSDTTNVPIAAVPTSNPDRPSSTFSSETDTKNRAVCPSPSNNILPLANEGASSSHSGRVNTRHDTSAQNSSRATGTSSTLDDTEGSQNHTGRSGITRETDRSPNIQTDPPERENTGVHNNAQHLDNPIVASNTNDRNGQLPRHLVTQRLNSLGINFDKPRYPAYATIMARLGSFENWPTTLTQKPEDMAKSGFLYAGYGDYARCFFCGGGLRNWEAGDDPWVEHARWFPRCQYLRQNKSGEFIQHVQELHQAEEAGRQFGVSDETKPAQAPRCNTSNDTMLSDAVKNVMEMGYTKEQIHRVLFTLDPESERRTLNPADILQHLLDQEENSDLHQGEETRSISMVETNQNQRSDEFRERLPLSDLDDTNSLMEENRRLKDQRMCKICLDQNANIAMLPCGHLCCCAECAPAMRKCPICRQFVKGTVKTFLV